MKRKIIYCALIMIGCTYGDRADWDSGNKAQRDYGEQQREEINEDVSNQLPSSGKPQTEVDQPY